MKNNENEIDVVVTWLDSNSDTWKKDFSHYKHQEDGDATLPRFRDWNNFHYWMRAIEVNMPWIRKLHLITNGTFPEWINSEHPKLNLVTHSDYIDSKYLPTFNSRVIEINLFRLEDLSEKFILFNDDFFPLQSLKEKDFFVEGYPCDTAIMNAHSGEGISNVLMNNLTVLNDKFRKREVIKKALPDWFNIKYGVNGNFRNLMLLAWPRFTGFYEPHLPQAYLKSNLEMVWSMFPKDFLRTCKSRFRKSSDINHFLFRYVHLVEGKFYPQKYGWLGKYYQADDNTCNDISIDIAERKYKIIAINDGDILDFDNVRNTINQALDKAYPMVSGYEKTN